MNPVLLAGVVVTGGSLVGGVALAVARGDPVMLLVGLAGGVGGGIAIAAGLRMQPEGPADRPRPIAAGGPPRRPGKDSGAGFALGDATTRIRLDPDELAAGSQTLPGLTGAYDKIAKGLIRAHLAVIAGPNVGRAAELKHDGSVTVGRGSDKTLDLKDPGVSVDQCVFEAQGDGVVVRDLASRNGTFVNGDKVETRKLANCDIIACGSTRILVTLSAGMVEITE